MRVTVVPCHKTIPLILSTLYYKYFYLAREKNISPDAAECFETWWGGGGEGALRTLSQMFFVMFVAQANLFAILTVTSVSVINL